MLTRRRFLELGAAAAALAGLAPRTIAAPASIEAGMRESKLIYLSPFKSNGELSRCQAEIWFVEKDGDMFVCTATDSWRARAPRQGLRKTRVWVGDVGVWTRSDGAYKNLPSVAAEASIVEDEALLDDLLDRFGDKYTMGWIVWSSRFRSGLEDGTRTMIRYSIV